MAKEIINTGTPDKRIVKFIESRHVLTLATSINDQPYCSSCFYAYHKEDNVLIFTSEEETRHSKEALINDKISGTIYLDTRIVGKIQGIQFTGVIAPATGEILKKYKLRFIKKFPYAAASISKVWFIELNYIKMTDNRLGFGTKLVWKPE